MAEDLPELAIHSHGMGQDSAAIHEMWSDTKFRETYGAKTIIVVSSDTGDEKDETTRYRIDILEPRLRELRLPYKFISTFEGFHRGSWANGGLIKQFKTNDTFGAVSFPPSCSYELKLAPIYKWLEHYVAVRYGCLGTHKRGLKAFAKAYGRVRMIIGFTKGEERRVAKDAQLTFDIDGIGEKPERDLWMAETIDKRFPLIDLGMTRGDVQNFLRDRKQPIPIPSCRREGRPRRTRIARL